MYGLHFSKHSDYFSHKYGEERKRTRRVDSPGGGIKRPTHQPQDTKSC